MTGTLDSQTYSALKEAAARGIHHSVAQPAARQPETTGRIDFIGGVMDSFDRTMLGRLFSTEPLGQTTLRWTNPGGNQYAATADPAYDRAGTR